MDSFFSKIFLDLQTRISTAVPEIKWIEFDLGQEQSSTRPNIQFPAVLIDFPDASYTEMGNGSQFCNVRISLKLVEETFSQSYNVAPDNVKNKALQFLEREHKLVSVLHGWAPDGGYCQPLIRESVSGLNRGDIGLRIRTLTFTTAHEAYKE